MHTTNRNTFLSLEHLTISAPCALLLLLVLPLSLKENKGIREVGIEGERGKDKERMEDNTSEERV